MSVCVSSRLDESFWARTVTATRASEIARNSAPTQRPGWKRIREDRRRMDVRGFIIMDSDQFDGSRSALGLLVTGITARPWIYFWPRAAIPLAPPVWVRPYQKSL